MVKADSIFGEQAACCAGIDDAPRHANHGAIRWHVLDDHGVGADAYALADGNRAKDLGAGTDHHAIGQRRVAFAFVPGGAAQRDAVVERDIVADYGGFPDHHAGAMVDEEAAANGGTGVNVDVGQHPAKEGQQAR